jgi:hypothetical protein
MNADEKRDVAAGNAPRYSAAVNEDVTASEIDRINELAEELNEEARDVLEYQVLSADIWVICGWVSSAG